ncbi:MAG: alpha/beta hydrolase [Rubrivivax sp.]|nr:alpha/beta hydrolase [Rubrivivax sp.]MCL4698235.1 alpha/beta hydrolase [Burkholderiaceae bacterium]
MNRPKPAQRPKQRGAVRSAFGTLAALAAALLLGACATPLPEGSFEQRLAGSGRPVVVFQSGLGDGLGVWSAVQQGLPGNLTSVAFSRAGVGQSPAAEGERSACRIAAEQRQMLQRAGLRPPYVLVGHSLGGLYQYAFARLYPAEVAGIVLLDPTHPQHWQRLQQEAPASAALVRVARLSPAFTRTMRREFDDQARCLDTLAARPMPPLPARLLVRGGFVPPDVGAFERVVRELWVDWARELGVPAATPVPGAGHYIQRDRPREVIKAIAEVASARG